MHQPVIQRLRRLSILLPQRLSQRADGFFSVDPQPEEAAVLIQLDVAYGRGVDQLLGQTVV